MTSATTSTTVNLRKFQCLLRELFQFDSADLDFGIYRIMNHKRDIIERFIREQLPAKVASELDTGPLAQQAQSEADLAEKAQQVTQTLGSDAVDPTGKLHPKYHSLPIGEEYLALKSQAADSSHSRDAVEAAIYNHLYTFFSRYYEEGDFISKRRYSRNERYAIPYNGEEVYLHWANSDQYYVKSDEHFSNYDWTAPNDVNVHFRLKSADVEQNNVKGDRRFFIPRANETHWNGDAKTVVIPVEYRPFTATETTQYGNRNQQQKIVAAAVPAILDGLDGPAEALAALTGEYLRNGNGPVSRLEHHLNRYVQRNNSDFFIHKDLAGFLNRELDFYLKNEVLNLETVVNAGQDVADGWFQQLRLTKSIGAQIIDFLAQIENFQKMLWEKRKFVTETQYCITLGTIDPDFYPEILANDCQWAEWRDLFGVEDDDRTVDYLAQQPTLVFDTRHYQVDFTDRLLASFDDVEAITDGLLVHGDNWQALNMLREKYFGRLDCIYADPPYNTDERTFVYKNGYKHSSWLSMVSNSAQLSYRLLASSGVFQMAINDIETHHLRIGLDSIFGQENRVATIAAEVNPAGQNIRPNTPALSHDYCHIYAVDIKETKMLLRNLTPLEMKNYTETDGSVPYLWDNLRRRGGNSRPADRPGQVFPLFVSDATVRVPVMDWNQSKEKWDVKESPTKGEIEIWPVDPKGQPRIWRVNPTGATEGIASGDISVITKAGRLEVVKKSYMPQGRKPKTLWYDSKYSATTYGTKLLNDILGQQQFSYPKSIFLVMDCLRFWTPEEGTVADYFAGSGTTGHAAINLNREDGGERKFMLVEMGEYFDTVLLPRIKKVTFTPEWKDGKPQRDASAEEAERSPRIVKYVRLESYEDALDSIQFDQPDGELPLFEDDEYLLKYMLRWETRDSETLLNVCKLTSPFSYCLRVHVNGEQKERSVDLPETFNYLLGLNIKTRKTYSNNDRRYLVYRGETRDAPGRQVTVIWRETEDWSDDDFASDHDFVRGKILGSDVNTVYVNGDSCIPGAKPIEPIFKARMFAGRSS